MTLTTAEDDYTLTDDPDDAATFYLKPTALGSYLLLSRYERVEGTAGQKQLLGITDPGGEFLDAFGNFIGEVGFLVSGVGDITQILVDVVDSGSGPVRDVGETVGDLGGNLGDINVSPTLAVVEEANDLAVWNLLPASDGRFSLTNAVTGQRLAAAQGVVALTNATTAGVETAFRLRPVAECDAYPEVSLNAELLDARGPALRLAEVPLYSEGPGAAEIDEDDVFGFIDAHSHITAYEFIGGRVNYGDPFHKFGVDHALHDCAVNHGPQGTLGVVETVTSTGTPTHETRGWPDFPFWPRHNSLQHHQSYYRWIERAYMGGLRLLVNHYTGNEILCQLNPQKQNACDFEENWRLQHQRILEMQDYIDAQNGGPGEGWFRIVDDPAQARAVIADGKLAVVLGIEISKLFNCGEFLGVAECSREELVQRLDAAYDLGVRHIFPIHKFDNAFGGVVPDEALGIGTILYAGNLAETGTPLLFEACPENFQDDSTQSPDSANPLGIIDQLLLQLEYINGQASQGLPVPPLVPVSENGLCNQQGITELGVFLTQELMRRNMIIEVDHSARSVIDRILEIAEDNGYPGVTSSHDWLFSEELLDRLVAGGGTISRFASSRETWVDKILKAEERPAKNRVAAMVTTGLASDVNGIASLPGNSGAADTPLYPFVSVDGRVRFDVQKTGDRAFGLYDGRGVAHYGLYPDQIADMQRFTEGKSRQEIEQALRSLFSSTEAYLRLWEATHAWRGDLGQGG
ncbi:hypothetical protein [Algiphilus sp.]|uniref:hypothetical protein n=1 Tax=Algiphilus sp. TaxID=1872431 RepID=UPI003B520C35